MSKKSLPFKAIFRSDQLGWNKFNNEQLGFGEIGAIHKGRKPESPYRLPNEWISSHVVQFLRLPIPPFAITWLASNASDLESQLIYSSLDFNYEREHKPLVQFSILYNSNPQLCAGILLSDILLANPDRTRTNFWVDSVANPKRVQMFDYDQSLLGGEHDGIPRLDALIEKLGLCYWSLGGSDHHPFLKLIDDAALMDKWFSRIYSIPKWWLADVCSSAMSIGLTNQEADAIQKFLWYRIRNLEFIIQQNKSEFTGVKDWKIKGNLF